jgi:cell division protein FtsB
MAFPKFDRVRIAMSAGVLLFVVIVGGLGGAFAQQLRLAQELGEDVKQLEQAVATQEATGAYLTATLEHVQTDDYVNQWAREEAKMAKPGEVVLIPVPGVGGSGPPATPTAEAQEDTLALSDERPFWEVWWEALFGPDARRP